MVVRKGEGSMKVGIVSDHRGIYLKKSLIELLIMVLILVNQLSFQIMLKN